MPPERLNEQEITLKKRARRRLVGALALVILMIIVLPMILKDRTAPAPQEAIKIVMPATLPAKPLVPRPVENTNESQVESTPMIESTPDKPTQPELNSEVEKSAEIPINSSKPAKTEKKLAIKEKLNTKTMGTITDSKPQSSFAVQIGVYSDLANVKQVQEKLRRAGYQANVETLKTEKGERFRIRTNNFSSRQDAATALAKLQAAGLPGMVISNG